MSAEQAQQDIEDWIARLRAVRGMGEQVAPEVARIVKADLEESITAGESPKGEKWKPTLEGKQPLQHAKQALYVAAYRGTVFVRIKGPEARHHRGTARGKIVRPIIPNTRRVPERMAAKIRRVLDTYWDRTVNHGGG